MSDNTIYINAGSHKKPIRLRRGTFYLETGHPLRFFHNHKMHHDFMKVPKDITRKGFYALRSKARKLSRYRRVWNSLLTWDDYAKMGVC